MSFDREASHELFEVFLGYAIAAEGGDETAIEPAVAAWYDFMMLMSDAGAFRSDAVFGKYWALRELVLKGRVRARVNEKSNLDIRAALWRLDQR